MNRRRSSTSFQRVTGFVYPLAIYFHLGRLELAPNAIKPIRFHTR